MDHFFHIKNSIWENIKADFEAVQGGASVLNTEVWIEENDGVEPESTINLDKDPTEAQGEIIKGKISNIGYLTQWM